MASGEQHFLEFGGSPVTTEFPGKLQFRLVDRVPVIALSHAFNEEMARAVRYNLVATVGPERPYYHRYPYVVLDVRMISEWLPGSGEFVGALRERLRGIGGELFLVVTADVPVPAAVPRFDAIESALAAAKEMRAKNRLASLRGS